MTRPSLHELPGRACSTAGALEVVGDRWALLVVREVSLGDHRFTHIARGTGAPRDRLTARLDDLVELGVLERRQCSATPPRSGCHLTASGRDLLPVLQALLQWGDRWVADEPPVTLHHEPRAPARSTASTRPGSAAPAASRCPARPCTGWRRGPPATDRTASRPGTSVHTSAGPAHCPLCCRSLPAS